MIKYSSLLDILGMVGRQSLRKADQIAAKNAVKNVTRANKRIWRAMSKNKLFSGMPKRPATAIPQITSIRQHPTFIQEAKMRGLDPKTLRPQDNDDLWRLWKGLTRDLSNKYNKARLGNVFERPPTLEPSDQAIGIPVFNKILYDPKLVTPSTLAHQNGHIFDAALRFYPYVGPFRTTKDVLRSEMRASALGLRALRGAGYTRSQIRAAHDQMRNRLRHYWARAMQYVVQTGQDYSAAKKELLGFAKNTPKYTQAMQQFETAKKDYIDALKSMDFPIPQYLQ